MKVHARYQDKYLAKFLTLLVFKPRDNQGDTCVCKSLVEALRKEQAQ